MVGTTFIIGTTEYHTDDLNLIQTSVNISPAEPRTKFIEIPHRNGALDLTEFLGSVTFGNREIKWDFTVKPTQDYAEVRRIVEQTLNGVKCHIILDEEPDVYYIGRLTVNGFQRDKLLYQITMSASCEPQSYEVDDG